MKKPWNVKKWKQISKKKENNMSLKCPECGNTDKFVTTVCSDTIVNKDLRIVERVYNHFFEINDIIECWSCGYRDEVKEFDPFFENLFDGDGNYTGG